MIAYKLLTVRADGTIGPLFINRKLRIPINVWMAAECHPTKGYAVRPGWHCTSKPEAPHFSVKGRAWFEVQIYDYTEFTRPKSQGGVWYIAKMMRVLNAVSHDTVIE